MPDPLLPPDPTPSLPPTPGPPGTVVQLAPPRSPRDPAAGGGPPGGSAGRYVLGEEIARGGMGEVYAARDTVLDRRVAVKTLQAHLAGDPEAVRRFLDEARVTGRLQHPAIPPVHDLGVLPDGRPFLAMKLIEGRTLAALLAERPADGPPAPARLLPVFEQMCQAVAYAHREGVIHRDLKPGNVMVGQFGEVQVMDWGLAKQVGSRGQETRDNSAARGVATTRAGSPDPPDPAAAPLTQAGVAVGTPGYMPPEQARGEIDRIDRRADVFALGAILCEIITGERVYAGPWAVVREKAETGAVGEALARVAAAGADADLADLVGRCLSADPAARPADAGEVAAVVAAHRAGVEERLRAAEAERAASAARAAEQWRRQRVWLGLAAALLVGTAGTGAFAYRADRARSDADTERGKAESALVEVSRKEQETQAALARATEEEKKAQAALARTTDALAEARAVTAFLTDDVLAQASPASSARGSKVTIDAVLHRAAARLDGRFADRPLVEAAVRHTLGDTFREIEELEAAEAHLARAWAIRKDRLGPDDPETLRTQVALARAVRNRRNGPNLDRAEALLTDALGRADRSLGPDHRVTQAARYNLARIEQDRGRHARAEADLRALLAVHDRTIGPDDPDTLQTLHALCTNLHAMGKFAELEEVGRRLIPAARRVLGEDSQVALDAQGITAAVLERRGDWAAALATQQQMWQGLIGRLGPDHRHTLAAMSGYADALHRAGRTAEADTLYRDLLARALKALPGDNADRYEFVGRFGAFQLWIGRPGEAAGPLQEAYDGCRRLEGPDSRGAFHWLQRLVRARLALGEYDRAEPLAEEAVRLSRALSPARVPEFQFWLGLAKLHAGRPAEAEAALRPALAAAEKGDPRSLHTADVRGLLGQALAAQGKFAEAEPHLLAAYAAFRRAAGSPSVAEQAVEVHAQIVGLYTRWGKPDEAAKWRARRSELPPDRAPPPREVRHPAGDR